MGKESQQGKSAKDLREEKGEDLGGENSLGGKGRERISTRKGGKRSAEGKGGRSRGEKRP